MEGERESDDRHHACGKEGEAFLIFRLREQREQHDVHREAANADHAGEEADPVCLSRAAPGMHGDDDSGEAGENGHRFLCGHALVQQKGGEQGHNHGRKKDEDVKNGERQVAQRDDYADDIARSRAARRI